MELAYKIYVGGNSYCYDYCLLYLIWAGNNAMRPSGWHPPHLVENADTLYLGNQHWQQAVLFFIYFYFFCVHQFAYVSVTLWVSGSLCNPSQVFKNSLLWGSQWPLKQKIIKTQWLTLGEWGCPLDNDPKLAKIAVSKYLGILLSFSTWFVVWCCVMMLWNVMVSSLV